jgi:Matrixin
MLMFDYFIPPQLSMEPTALIAQATSSKQKTLKPFTFCTDIESGVPNSTANAFTVFRNGEYNPEKYINHKVRLIQPPAHGKVTFSEKTPFVVGITETGIKSYLLEFWPTENYIGKDRAVFEVEANGKKYRVTVNFWVMATVFDDGLGGDTNCKQQKFGLNSDAPQNVSDWQRSADLSAFLAAASGVTYSFTDLPATALGQTTGQGLSAQITLDTYAAGHGWYIYPTQLDPSTSSGLANSNYLPTSGASVRQAKAGSAAAGKIDMLSVLLHEYGHALGLEHSGNGADFMTRERGQDPLNPFGHAET